MGWGWKVWPWWSCCSVISSDCFRSSSIGTGKGNLEWFQGSQGGRGVLDRLEHLDCTVALGIVLIG